MAKKASETENVAQQAVELASGTRHRSPNYPAISLKRAVERAKELNEKYKRSLVPEGLAHVHWGYKPFSSGAQQTTAALRAFGLLDVDGKGKDRKVRVSESAFRIMMNSSDRAELLKKAALSPAIHDELWKKYTADGGIPEPEIIKHYLLLDRVAGRFNEESVDSFISHFLGSLRYAGLSENGNVDGSDDANQDGDGSVDAVSAPVTVGSRVQWTSQGAEQFREPQLVLGLSDDRKWAFVEGSSTGLPVEQLSVVVPKMEAKKTDAKSPTIIPPPNPFSAGQNEERDGKKWDVPTLTFPLPRGNVIEIRLKSKVTPKEFEKIKALIDLSESSFLIEDEEP
jgi:hypothetical protein